MSNPLLNRRRYAHSGPFIKTNHQFGEDLTWFPSTYEVDYSSRQIHGHYSRDKAAMNTIPCASPPKKKRLKSISEDEWLNDSTPHFPALNKAKMNAQISSTRKPQKNNVMFGNDPPERLTAYAEFAMNFGKYKNTGRMLCTPPEPAEIFPLPTGAVHHEVLTVGSDLPGMADKVHEGRLGDLRNIKNIHVNDSVAYTLKQAAPTRMMSRSMVDYSPPKERLRGNVCLRQAIAPEVRMDSIWTSIGGARKNYDYTETMQNYSWPLSWPTKRYQRGQMNKVR